MAKKTLVNEDIKIGERILKLLDANNIDVSSAFWFLFSDIQEWRFVLAISDFDKIGSQKTYLKILKILNKEQIEEQDFPFEIIIVVSPNSSINTLMGSMIHTGGGISGIRFSGNVINGTMIEDAYIYRVNLPVLL